MCLEFCLPLYFACRCDDSSSLPASPKIGKSFRSRISIALRSPPSMSCNQGQPGNICSGCFIQVCSTPLHQGFTTYLGQLKHCSLKLSQKSNCLEGPKTEQSTQPMGQSCKKTLLKQMVLVQDYFFHVPMVVCRLFFRWGENFSN